MKTIILIAILAISLTSQAQWEVQLDGCTIPHITNDIYFTSMDTGYISCWNGKLYKTTNGGLNWNFTVIAPDRALTSVYFLNSNTGYCTATSGLWLKTTDAGNSFSSATNSGYGGSLEDIFFIDENTGWCVGGNGSGTNFVSKTTDGGDNWIVKKNFTEHESPYSITFLDHNVGFTSAGKNIYRSTDGGESWNLQFISGDYIYNYSFFGSIGYGVGENGKILKSTNSGVNWFQLSSPAGNNFLYECSFLDASTGWIVGDNGLILYTSDGGANFIMQTSNTTKKLTSLFARDGKAWCVGYRTESDTLSGIILSFIPPSINISVTLLIQGFYYPGFNQMIKSEPVKVYLHESTYPFSRIDSANAVIDSITFRGLFQFSNAASGSYYIVAKQFNSIETWSKSGGEIISKGYSTYSYDFTTAVSQAYGNNLKLKGGKYCMYSGDINQDGIVDASDLSQVDNDSFSGLSGSFLGSDVNGDGFVDASDITIVDNNRAVVISRPYF